MGKQELLDRARDELFSHIHRCGVLQANVDDQDSWMTETIEYLAERYPDLGSAELTKLRTVGLRFCQPVISRLTKEEPAEDAAVAVSMNGEAVLDAEGATDAAGDTEPEEAAAAALTDGDGESPADIAETMLGAVTGEA